MRVLVTGADGFIGKNLIEALSRYEDIEIMRFTRKKDWNELEELVDKADVICHLAGVNRPKDESEFELVNVGITNRIIQLLHKHKKKCKFIMSSSKQAEIDNPYGKSKLEAENLLIDYKRTTGADIYIYRLPSVFGKWCRPNYNSVVATFCYNISHNIDIEIHDPNKQLQLVYIDDVINHIISILHKDEVNSDQHYYDVTPIHCITIKELANKLYQIKNIRNSLIIPDLSDLLLKRLHSTYLSYLDTDDFAYSLDLKKDNRGSLVEVLKSPHFGQIFLSDSHEGVIRGNHYHNSKTEKFCVVKGKALIKFRKIFSDEVITYEVSGEDIKVVDIPPGYTHSIENISKEKLTVLFWANEMFNPEEPDTYIREV